MERKRCVYSDWYHLPRLSPWEVTASLHAKYHNQWMIEAEPVELSVNIVKE
jgi:hypothetical protein